MAFHRRCPTPPTKRTVNVSIRAMESLSGARTLQALPHVAAWPQTFSRFTSSIWGVRRYYHLRDRYVLPPSISHCFRLLDGLGNAERSHHRERLGSCGGNTATVIHQDYVGLKGSGQDNCRSLSAIEPQQDRIRGFNRSRNPGPR